MEKLLKVEGVAAVLAIDNIDTDQIISAEYLKITDKSGLGEHLFANWRYNADEKNNRIENEKFVLNQAETRRAKVLIAGDNFGCGSSREHAPWALVDYGIQVVISSSIADIFRNNAYKNGLLPVVVSPEQHKNLLKLNGEEIEVDIESLKIITANETIDFELESFAQYCFLNGMDQLDFLLSHLSSTEKYEQDEAVFR